MNDNELLSAILFEIQESRKDMKALTKSINRLVDTMEVDA